MRIAKPFLTLALAWLCAEIASAESLKVVWKLPLEAVQIRLPVFSPDGSELAFTVSGYMPEGNEAEGYSEGALGSYLDKKSQIARFEEPRITIAKVGTQKAQETASGWDPCFSPDGNKIYFMAQVKPLAEFRGTSTPFSYDGDTIAVYDRSTQKTETLATPAPYSGYFGNPSFGAMPAELVFRRRGPLEGQYAASESARTFDVNTREASKDLPIEKLHGLYCAQQRGLGEKEDPTEVRSPNRALEAHFEDKNLTIIALPDGHEVTKWKAGDTIESATWSMDSKRLAIVTVSKSKNPNTYKQTLTVLDLR